MLTAASYPAWLVVATQSTRVTTLKPRSQAARTVDSTQQLAMKPATARVLIPPTRSSDSSSVPGNALRAEGKIQWAERSSLDGSVCLCVVGVRPTVFAGQHGVPRPRLQGGADLGPPAVLQEQPVRPAARQDPQARVRVVRTVCSETDRGVDNSSSSLSGLNTETLHWGLFGLIGTIYLLSHLGSVLQHVGLLHVVRHGGVELPALGAELVLELYEEDGSGSRGGLAGHSQLKQLKYI